MPGSWPTRAMRPLRTCFSRSATTAAKLPSGASDSALMSDGRGLTPAATISAVCRARTSGLVSTTSSVTPRRDRPRTDFRMREMPSSVNGRFASSGHELPRSSASPWRIR